MGGREEEEEEKEEKEEETARSACILYIYVNVDINFHETALYIFFIIFVEIYIFFHDVLQVCNSYSICFFDFFDCGDLL